MVPLVNTWLTTVVGYTTRIQLRISFPVHTPFLLQGELVAVGSTLARDWTLKKLPFYKWERWAKRAGRKMNAVSTKVLPRFFFLQSAHFPPSTFSQVTPRYVLHS
jgi:hypothetical protein